MNDPTESQPKEEHVPHLRCEPSVLHLGANYVGARIEGAFRVGPATSAEPIYAHYTGLYECTNGPPPDWLKLDGPRETRKDTLAWSFAVNTDEPGERSASLHVECDTGNSLCNIKLKLKDGKPSLGDLVFCMSPLSKILDTEGVMALVRVLSGLDFRVHYVDSLTAVRDTHPRTLVLHACGLIDATTDDRKWLASLVGEGTNLIVVANECFRGTTEAANRLLTHYDMQMLQDGTEEPGITDDEWERRHDDWSKRYSEALCTQKEIVKHPLTEGARRLYWFRPSPVVLTGSKSHPLVTLPGEPDRCVVAMCQPGGYVVAVGTPLIYYNVTSGWPFNNDRLFANLLVGDDAEQFVSLS